MASKEVPPKVVRHGEDDEEEEEEDEEDEGPVTAPGGAAEESEEEDTDGGDASDDDGAGSSTGAVAVPDGEGVEAMTGALASLMAAVIKPSVQTLSDRLVELQETQHMLVSTVMAQRQDLVDGSEQWREAKAVLDAIPEYIAKIGRVRKLMTATEGQLVKTLKQSAQLRSKLEEKERERAARKAASASAFASVAK